MNNLIINIKVNPNLYKKDPLSASLGKKILENSVLLIDEMGLEQFTFKKLAKDVGTTEASIYRYFENKHHLFVYLLNWYWEWMAARIDLNTLNISSPAEKLKIVLTLIVDSTNRHANIEFVDEQALHRIVVIEGAKGYHHKMVDSENQDGFFLAYKRLTGKIAKLIKAINPDFPYPRALASTLIEAANNNLYFAQHLPRLTDLKKDASQLPGQVKNLLEFFAFGLIYNNVISGVKINPNDRKSLRLSA